MKTIIKLAAACTLALSLAACESAPTKTLDEANMAIKSAMAANGKAKKMYVEWRDTGKVLKEARAAKGKGKFDEAVKLAGKAERQAINAVKQHEEQKDVQPRL
jgi:starvation-inducible outer membrane lipoprotein